MCPWVRYFLKRDDCKWLKCCTQCLRCSLPTPAKWIRFLKQKQKNTSSSSLLHSRLSILSNWMRRPASSVGQFCRTPFAVHSSALIIRLSLVLKQRTSFRNYSAVVVVVVVVLVHATYALRWWEQLEHWT